MFISCCISVVRSAWLISLDRSLVRYLVDDFARSLFMSLFRYSGVSLFRSLCIYVVR